MHDKRTRRNFRRVMQRDGSTCRYCGAPADCVDHVLPWAFRRDNSLGNLVAACTPCNVTGSDLIFPSFEEKRAYILARRNLPVPALTTPSAPAAAPAELSPLVTVVEAIWEDVTGDDGPWVELPDAQCSGITKSGRRCKLLRSECVFH